VTEREVEVLELLAQGWATVRWRAAGAVAATIERRIIRSGG